MDGHFKKEREMKAKMKIQNTKEFMDDLFIYWVENHIHTTPVALSLRIIDKFDPIKCIQGRTKGRGLFPFFVQTKSGKIFTKATEIHQYANLLLKKHKNKKEGRK